QSTAGAVIAPPGGSSAVEVAQPGVVVEGFTFQGGLHGLHAQSAAGISVRRCTASGQSANGIMIVQSDRAVIDGTRVTAPGGQGIVVKQSGNAYVQNNLVTGSGEWGIQVDNGDTPLPPVTGGNIVAFNTVSANGQAAGSTTGGIRFQNATGEIRDN